MIWLLVALTLSGHVVMQPFADKKDCESVRRWMIVAAGSNNNSTVKESTCIEIKDLHSLSKKQNSFLKVSTK